MQHTVNYTSEVRPVTACSSRLWGSQKSPQPVLHAVVQALCLCFTPCHCLHASQENCTGPSSSSFWLKEAMLLCLCLQLTASKCLASDSHRSVYRLLECRSACTGDWRALGYSSVPVRPVRFRPLLETLWQWGGVSLWQWGENLIMLRRSEGNS